MITYQVLIDYNHDGNFTDIGEDISASVIEARWQLGMTQAYDSMADISHAQLTVRNPSGQFSPERTPLQSGTGVRIQSYDGTTTRTHFTGFIGYVEPTAGEWGEKQTVIHLHDCQVWLDDSPVLIAPQVDVTADTVIDTLLNKAIIRRSTLAGYCIIDVDGYNHIDSVTIFPPDTMARTLEAGRTRFAYVGDWWEGAVPARQAIRELVTSERGRFYINRTGEAIFLNRHHTLLRTTLSATFNDDMHGLDYRYGADRLNRIVMVMTPREVGVNDTVIWELDNAQLIPQGTRLTTTLRFVDAVMQPIGMLALDSVTSAFHLQADGSGSPLVDGVAVEIMQVGFTSMQVQIVNAGAVDVYLTQLTIRGKPLYRAEPLELVVADGEGMYVYGVRSTRYNLPALSDVATAQAFAQYDLSRRKHPAGVVHQLTTTTHDHPAQALGLTLFDRIRITETHTGHNAQDYFIVAESHHVTMGGAGHTVTWTLEPADSARFVIIDDTDINDGQRVIAPY